MSSPRAPSRPRARRPAALAGLGLVLCATLPVACGGGADGGLDLGEPTLPSQPAALDPELVASIDEHVARVRAAPDEGGWHGTLGLVYEANNLWPEARECFEKARALDPGDPVWHLHAAIAQERLGDLPAALESVREGARRHPAFAPLQGRLGDLLLERGEVEGARAAYAAARDLAPRAPEPLVGLGEVALIDGQPEEAVRLLERAVELDGGYRSAHYVLGLAYRALGRDEDAERELALGARGTKRGLRDSGTSQLGRYAVGTSRPLLQSQRLLNQGRNEEAARLLEPLVERYPDNSRLFLNLGLAWFRLGRAEEAVGALVEAERLEPTFHMIPFNQAGFLMQLGRPADALERVGRALELAPEFAPAWFVRGRALLELGRDDEAAEALREAERRAPQDPEVQRALGDLAREQGRPDEARERYERASQQAPGDWRPWGDLFHLALEGGDLEAAQRALDGAQRVAPSEPGVRALARELDEARAR